MQNILKLLDLVLEWFAVGSAAYERFNDIRVKLQNMQAEGRDPTPEEWDALFADIEENSGRLAAADHRLNPG